MSKEIDACEIALAKYLADHVNKTIDGVTQMFKAGYQAALESEEVKELVEALERISGCTTLNACIEAYEALKKFRGEV